jgi:hypothetical protein
MKDREHAKSEHLRFICKLYGFCGGYLGMCYINRKTVHQRVKSDVIKIINRISWVCLIKIMTLKLKTDLRRQFLWA